VFDDKQEEKGSGITDDKQEEQGRCQCVANAGVSGKVSNGRTMKNSAHSEIVTAHNAAA